MYDATRALGAYVFLFVAAVASLTSAQTPRTPLPTEQPDSYQWLEEVRSPRAMAWVSAENARTAKVLEEDPRFPQLQAEALKLLESPDRLPTPRFREGQVYNTWQDAEHVQGILRSTTLADYQAPQPHWRTVIDYDALGRTDKVKWVAKGLQCLYPGDEFCLVALSDGGEDATTLREFNLKTGKFVEGGFVLPHSKQNVAWVDKDTLLVARDWGTGTMTAAGYPFVVKQWKRGQLLAQAREIFRGSSTDTESNAESLNDAQGHAVTLLERALNFFELEVSLPTPGGIEKLALPTKIEVDGLLAGRLILTLNQDWKPAGSEQTFVQGSVVSLDLAALRRAPGQSRPTLVFAPTAQEFAQSVSLTRSRLLLTTLDHVQGKAYIYTPQQAAGWTSTSLPIPANKSIEIDTTNTSDDSFFLDLEGLITPRTLLLGNAATGELKLSKALPPQFDASRDMVEQLAAISRDGTRVPYFIVHRKDLEYNGANPTLLEAYGGFQVSSTPDYSATLGKLWLERGGVYVLANIRGGGEFGPAWHEAGLKTNRQRIYDDFAAVGADLIARKITTPRRLGIEGGSNGGLLVGVEMTQHPEMWHAVAIQVPLLDMLRFEHIAAGASWVGEYGSVAVPDERRFLASISPYNQLRADVPYPEPLIYTSTEDDRVGPAHARKFAARMEESHKPFYYQEITEGGHAQEADLKAAAQVLAVRYVYFLRKLVD